MQQVKWFFPFVIFLGLSILLWRSLSLNPHQIPSPLINKPAPSFVAFSLFDPTKKITQSIFKKHISVVNIFASWCISCHAEHPQLMEFHKHYPLVQLIGIAFKDDSQTVLKFLKSKGNPYTEVINDESGNIGIDFGVYGTPETFVIDQQGIIRDKISGPISPDILTEQLLPLIKKMSES